MGPALLVNTLDITRLTSVAQLRMSAHDIAVEYAEYGVGASPSHSNEAAGDFNATNTDVTMFQRESTYVMSVKNAVPIFIKRKLLCALLPHTVSNA